MGSIEWEEGRHDGGICGQCICPEHSDGLSAAPVDGPADRCAPSTETVSAGSPGGRRLCCGGFSAWGRFSGHGTGKGGSRRSAGTVGLWWGRKAAPPDTAFLCCLLWIRGLCAGPGTAGGQCRPDGERHLLHRCERQSPYNRYRRGLCGADSGVPGCSEARCQRRNIACADLHRWTNGGTDGPVGQRQHPVGPGRRTVSAGAGSRHSAYRIAGRSTAAADAGRAACSDGRTAASAPDGTGTAPPSGAVSRSGTAGWPAVDTAHRLDGDRRDTVSRTVRGPFADGVGSGIYSPVGRRGQKGRKA